MTNRFAPFLDRFARVLLLGAVVAPLLFVVAQIIPGRPDIRWGVSVPWFSGPEIGATASEFAHGPWGSVLVVANTGTGDSERVRVVFADPPPLGPTRPSHVEVRGRDLGDYELVSTDEGATLDLGAMEPGERLEVVLFHVTWMDVDAVLHGDEAIAETDRPSLFDPRLHLPRWAALAVLFLLAGLAVQVLALRGHAARKEMA